VLDAVCAWKLGSLAFKLLAGAFKVLDHESIATFLEIGANSVEAGEAMRDTRADVPDPMHLYAYAAGRGLRRVVAKQSASISLYPCRANREFTRRINDLRLVSAPMPKSTPHPHRRSRSPAAVSANAQAAGSRSKQSPHRGHRR
jgi:hypothetical protein